MTEPGMWADQRDAAYQGFCPVCGSGPWQALGKHVARTHGIPARTLKVRLGIPVSHSLDDPQITEGRRERGQARGAPRGLISAGRTSSRDRDLEPGEARAGQTAKRIGLARARRISADVRRKIPEKDLPKIRERIAAGEKLAAVAADYGCTASAVCLAVNRDDPPPVGWAHAAPAREHLASLRDAGMPLARVAAAAGLPPARVYEIFNGHKGRDLPRFIIADHANRILAVELDTSRPHHRQIDPTGTMRRLQALIVCGWSGEVLAARSGLSQASISNMVRGKQSAITARVCDTVRALFDDLADKPPDIDTIQAWNGTRHAQTSALRAGWAPPAAWSGVDIDDPAAEPNPDVTAPVLKRAWSARMVAAAAKLDEARQALGTATDDAREALVAEHGNGVPVTVDEAASLLGISVDRARRWLRGEK